MEKTSKMLNAMPLEINLCFFLRKHFGILLANFWCLRFQKCGVLWINKLALLEFGATPLAGCLLNISDDNQVPGEIAIEKKNQRG